MENYPKSADEVMSQIQSRRRARPSLSTPFVAPQNRIQSYLATFWTEVLLIESIGIHDNFFDLGCDSIQMMRVISRIYDQFAVEVTLGELFDNLTVEELARHLSDRVCVT